MCISPSCICTEIRQYQHFQTQSCLFLGKILNDDQPLSEYKIDEKGFVVVMVTKVIIFNSYLVQFQVLKVSNYYFI